MRIFEVRSEADSFWCTFPSGGNDENFQKKIDGRSLFDQWQVMDFKYDKDFSDKNIKLIMDGKSDTPTYAAHIPVYSKKAVHELSDLISPFGEFLKINIQEEDEEYFIFNVTNFIDALDMEKSEIKYFKSSGRIMRIKDYYFKSEKIKEQHIFKLLEPRYKAPFVSEEFVKIVEESGLKGFRFKLVWEG